MDKGIKVIEYLENEFDLEISHLQKVDLEKILTKKESKEELLLPVVGVNEVELCNYCNKVVPRDCEYAINCEKSKGK